MVHRAGRWQRGADLYAEMDLDVGIGMKLRRDLAVTTTFRRVPATREPVAGTFMHTVSSDELAVPSTPVLDAGEQFVLGPVEDAD